MKQIWICFVVICFCHIGSILAQSSSSAEASMVANQALMALTGGIQINSVRMTGTATRYIGQPETGMIVLEAQAPKFSRVTETFGAKTRIEIRGEDATQSPWGVWIGSNGQAHAMVLHNCWTPPIWFLPQMTDLSNLDNGDALFQLPDHDGHLIVQKQRRIPGQMPAIMAMIAGLSTKTLSLDMANDQPVHLRYFLHPDADLGRNIPVKVAFSDYQKTQGVWIPMHIQQYMQHALLLDIQIESVTINPALPASDFARPDISGSNIVHSVPGK